MRLLLRSISPHRRGLLDHQAEIAAFPGLVLMVWAADDKAPATPTRPPPQRPFLDAELALTGDSSLHAGPFDDPFKLASTVNDRGHRRRRTKVAD